MRSKKKFFSMLFIYGRQIRKISRWKKNKNIICSNMGYIKIIKIKNCE